MADTFTILNGASVIWGTEADKTEGTVIDSNVEDTAQFEKVENNQGAVVGVVVYDTETVATISILAKSGATKPAIGSSISIGGVLAWVTKSAIAAGNKTASKINVTATKWTNCAPSA